MSAALPQYASVRWTSSAGSARTLATSATASEIEAATSALGTRATITPECAAVFLAA
jgi:hypothetical protein